MSLFQTYPSSWRSQFAVSRSASRNLDEKKTGPRSAGAPMFPGTPDDPSPTTVARPRSVLPGSSATAGSSDRRSSLSSETSAWEIAIPFWSEKRPVRTFLCPRFFPSVP
jgi:hypothetical protein